VLRPALPRGDTLVAFAGISPERLDPKTLVEDLEFLIPKAGMGLGFFRLSWVKTTPTTDNSLFALSCTGESKFWLTINYHFFLSEPLFILTLMVLGSLIITVSKFEPVRSLGCF
jgi:hypothetical protein